MHNWKRKRIAWKRPSPEETARAIAREAIKALLMKWIAKLDRELGDGKEPR